MVEADRACAVVCNNGGVRRVVQHSLDLFGLIDCPGPVEDLGIEGLEDGPGGLGNRVSGDFEVVMDDQHLILGGANVEFHHVNAEGNRLGEGGDRVFAGTIGAAIGIAAMGNDQGLRHERVP